MTTKLNLRLKVFLKIIKFILFSFRPLILSVLRRIPYSLPGLPNDEVDHHHHHHHHEHNHQYHHF